MLGWVEVKLVQQWVVFVVCLSNLPGGDCWGGEAIVGANRGESNKNTLMKILFKKLCLVIQP